MPSLREVVVVNATPTRRGVLWLGLHCDVRCEFCYDELMPAARKRWVELDHIKLALEKFRFYYQNEYVDFMGGEPTLHPAIVEVVSHAAQIGLRPTIITHGMRLADPDFARGLRDAGVHDFLVSIHGIGDTVRLIHGRGTNNAGRQLEGLRNLQAMGVPFRFNVTVVRENLRELTAIAELAAETGARVVNFLTFNPYFEWSESGEIPFQVRHGEAAVELRHAIDILTRRGIEANVRYFPLCLLDGYEQHVFTGHQLPFDTHEWDYNSWYDRGAPGRQSADWYRNASGDQQERHDYVHAEPCLGCAARGICDGLHAQYLDRFGANELRPYTGTMIDDPRHFISSQPNVVSEPDNPAPDVDVTKAGPLPLTQFEDAQDNRAGVRVEITHR